MQILSGVELARVYLAEGRLADARSTLVKAKREAANSRLRVIEARAAAALAEVYLAQGNAGAAETEAQASVRIAEGFSGRPLLYAGYATLGEAYQALGRPEEAVEAFAKAAQEVEWIRNSALPEHSSSFLARPDVKALFKKSASRLSKDRAAGR